MVGCWVAVVCPQHHAAEGMQMSFGTVSPSLSKYRRVHIYGRTRAKIGIHILERGLCLNIPDAKKNTHTHIEKKNIKKKSTSI